MTSKFLGCILQIKTKSKQNIIGTVRAIDLDKQQAIILDDAMANGQLLKDGYVVSSTSIADLQVIGRAEEKPKVERSSSSDEEEFQKIQKPKPWKPEFRQKGNLETFASDVDVTTEFDFERSNLLFEKLPVTITPKANLPNHRNPKFSNHDTTTKSERRVASVSVKNSLKTFSTDTGISIPAIDLCIRSKILNSASELGLSHERTLETFSNLTAQIATPLLGPAHLLSPERPTSLRPTCLVLAGPHWQGAVAVSLARILSTLGVKTVVYSPKEERSILAREEKLYKLSGELITRRKSDVDDVLYDLVVVAMDAPCFEKFSEVGFRGREFLYVDPPLGVGEGTVGSGGRTGQTEVRTAGRTVVMPILPLAYNFEKSVRCFVVNLGVPRLVYEGEGVGFKSFYGDKSYVRVFWK